MGFMGLGLYQKLTPYLDVGVNSYAAVSGDLGGFITIGAGARAQYPLTRRLDLKAGLDLGAGGGRGGFTISGGGLMLRESIGLEYRPGEWGRIGVGISHIDFPDGGSINSVQPYLAYSYAFDDLHRPGWGSEDLIPSRQQLLGNGNRHELALVSRFNQIPTGVNKDSGAEQTDFSAFGIEWRSFLNDHFFIGVGSEAAISGDSTGYMQILLGAGLVYPLSSHTNASLQLDIGAGGGGGVDTGGGTLVKMSGSLQYLLGPHWHASLSAGRIQAADASFKANEVGLSLGYNFGPAQSVAAPENGPDIHTHRLRLRMSEQLYLKAAEGWRTHHADENINNLGIQVDYFLTPRWFLTGQGFAAHHGNAGAYMTGLVGAGMRVPLTSRWSAELEAVTGAAGGGGLATAGGWLAQVNAGLNYQITSTLSAQLTLGEAKAVYGEFRAHVLGLSLNYHERLYERR